MGCPGSASPDRKPSCPTLTTRSRLRLARVFVESRGTCSEAPDTDSTAWTGSRVIAPRAATDTERREGQNREPPTGTAFVHTVLMGVSHSPRSSSYPLPRLGSRRLDKAGFAINQFLSGTLDIVNLELDASPEAPGACPARRSQRQSEGLDEEALVARWIGGDDRKACDDSYADGVRIGPRPHRERGGPPR